MSRRIRSSCRPRSRFLRRPTLPPAQDGVGLDAQAGEMGLDLAVEPAGVRAVARGGAKSVVMAAPVLIEEPHRPLAQVLPDDRGERDREVAVLAVHEELENDAAPRAPELV